MFICTKDLYFHFVTYLCLPIRLKILDSRLFQSFQDGRMVIVVKGTYDVIAS